MDTISDKPPYFMNNSLQPHTIAACILVPKLFIPANLQLTVWFQWLAGAERLTRGGSKYLAGSFAKRVIAPD